MSEEKKPESPKTISRREFAIGSMAIIGAHSSFAQEPPEPLSDAANALKLDIPADIKALMEDRHILEEDVRRVIEHAESTGMKLYQTETDHLLSKLRIYNAMFYVDYSPVKDAKDSYRIHTAYSHRFKLDEEE